MWVRGMAAGLEESGTEHASSNRTTIAVTLCEYVAFCMSLEDEACPCVHNMIRTESFAVVLATCGRHFKAPGGSNRASSFGP
jgi:hypothetical protein